MAEIALNAQYSPNRGKVFPCSAEDYDRLINEPWLAQAIDKIREGDETEKARLPFMCPHFSEFKDNRRAQSCIIPKAFTWHTMVDIDDKDKVPEAGETALRLNMDENSIWYRKLKLAAYSARKKLHLYIELPLGMTIHETQEAYCKAIGVEADTDCETPERMIYVTDIRQEIYRAEDFLKPLSEEEISQRLEAMKGKCAWGGRPTPLSPPVSREGKQDTKVNAEAPQRESVTNTPSLRNGTGNGGGSSSSPRGGWEGASIAFDLCVKHAGLDPKKMDIWGEHNWHANLMAVLSTGLPKLMKKEQLMAVVAEKLPNYYQYPDCKALIDYFYDNYQADKGFMSAALREINAKAQTVAPSPALPREGAANASMGDADEDNALASLSDGYNPPEPPKKLSRIHQLITRNFDPRYTPMILLASVPEMSAHASHYRGPYINGKEIGPQDYVAVIGASGKGKNNVTDLHNMMIERTLFEHDKKEYQKCDANAEEREKKKNAKDCPPKYHPKLRIIETASSTSILDLQASLGKNGMLLGHFSEADAFCVAGGTNTKLLSTLIRKGWSGEVHTQYYMSDCSRNVMARMCMSLLVCGTVNSVVGGMLSGKNTENGLMQRFIPVVVPKAKRTFRPPVCNRLNDEEKEELQQMMVRLYTQDLALGDSTLTLDMPLTRKAIERWYDDLEERYNNGEVTEAEADLSTRVGEHMMRAAIPLVALDGKETKEMLEFIRWVGDVAYYNLCWIFGHSVQKNLDEAKEIMGSHQDLRKTSEPLLDKLPNIFTVKQMSEVRVSEGQSADCYMLLSRYVKSKKIIRLQKGVYQKANTSNI